MAPARGAPADGARMFERPGPPGRHLLAVDLGLSTGLALYEHPGQLRWYGSRHFPNLTSLKRGIRSLLSQCPPLEHLVLEGHRGLAERWKQGADGVSFREVSAETWRAALLLPRQRQSAELAKRAALEKAREIIARSGLPRPTALRHDTAEAILIGWWGVGQVWTGPAGQQAGSGGPREETQSLDDGL